MTAKTFLLSVLKAERELKLISAKKQHYNDLICSIGANTGKAVILKPTGASKTETAAVGLVFLNERLLEKEKEYTSLVVKAEKLIDQLKQDNFRKILTLKYLCDWSWKSINDEMGFKDEKSVYACHRFAVRELQKLM